MTSIQQQHHGRGFMFDGSSSSTIHYRAIWSLKMMIITTIIVLINLIQYVAAQKEYQGLYLGKLNTYSHQVTGEIYAIDEHTLLIRNFFYDGLGQDTFFWAGSTLRPSSIGFIVPDEVGRTNKLQRYVNKDLTIRLPDDKKITSIKWFAVWDIRTSRNFADIYIPEGFEPPSPQRVSELSRLDHGVRSGPVIVLNSKQIKIPNFNYDGKGEAFFWVGNGPQPHPSGHKIPDEKGYIDLLGRYEDEDIILTLPGEETVFEIDWIAVWNPEKTKNYGSVIIPDGLNIPPALVQLNKYESRLPNCEQLHSRIQLNWEIFGPQITFEVIAQIDTDDYFALGISGSENRSQMIGSDVAISYLDGHLGFTYDYNITAKYPCTNVLGRYQGVCRDEKVGGVDNYQIHTFTRENDVTRITYRRNLLNTGDDGDRIIAKQGTMTLVWAVGKYNKFREPRFHYLYPKGLVKIDFGRKPSEKNCFAFAKIGQSSPLTAPSVASDGLIPSKDDKAPWGPLKLTNRTATLFYARIGEPGGVRGYQGTTGVASPGYVWYINGLMAPDLTFKRGLTYTFKVEGGSNPSNARFYHPLYITDDQYGGYIKYSDSERKGFQIFAGIEWDRKGRPRPTSAGRLCLWSTPNGSDARKADNYATFISYRDSLKYNCEKGSAAHLIWTPNASTPDVVYYQSYTQRNMGGKIYIVDDYITSAAAFVSMPKNLFIFILFIILNLISSLFWLYPNT